MSMIAALALAFFGLASPAAAQLVAAKEGPVVFGHYHLRVTSTDAHQKFWGGALGGRAMTLGPSQGIAFPNVFVLLQQGPPEQKTTTVDHIAFQVSGLPAIVQRLRAGGYALTTRADVNRMYRVEDDIADVTGERMSVAFVTGPDGVKVELIERRNAAREPVAPAHQMGLDHVHFTAQDFTAMKQWYMNATGATIGNQTYLYKSLDLPGLPSVLQFSRLERAAFELTGSPGPNSSPPVPAGTRGSVVDHIGFEVKGLEAFSREMETKGITLDVPYRRVPAVGIGVAFVSDPWGTYIELTDGLAALP